jgi:alkylated DNA repair dioxygenase AlkB
LHRKSTKRRRNLMLRRVSPMSMEAGCLASSNIMMMKRKRQEMLTLSMRTKHGSWSKSGRKKKWSSSSSLRRKKWWRKKFPRLIKKVCYSSSKGRRD